MTNHIETADYSGADRRESVPSETYKLLCKDRFLELHIETAEVRADTQYLRRKVDNGLSTLPGKMTWLQATFVTLIITIAVGVGVWTHQLGVIEERIDSQIATSEKLMDHILAQINELK